MRLEGHSKRTECKWITNYCKEGWPHRSKVPDAVNTFLSMANEITMLDGLLVRGKRIIIPSSMCRRYMY